MSNDEHLEPCPLESSCVGSGLYALTLDKTREEAIAAWNRRVTLE